MYYQSKQIKLFISLLSLVLFTQVSQAQPQDSDPCNNLPGTWKGIIYTEFSLDGYCELDAEIKFLKYADTVRMEGTAQNPRGTAGWWHCKSGSVSEVGTCKNALISLGTRVGQRTGTVFGNEVILELSNQGGYQRITLKK